MEKIGQATLVALAWRGSYEIFCVCDYPGTLHLAGAFQRIYESIILALVLLVNGYPDFPTNILLALDLLH